MRGVIMNGLVNVAVRQYKVTAIVYLFKLNDVYI